MPLGNKRWLHHMYTKRKPQSGYSGVFFYGYARELSKVLEYKDFRNFELTIYKAMVACENSNNKISDHFGEVTEMVSICSGAKRGFKSYALLRYACYLIVMNGDVSKEIIALGQTYFAVKTRQQELIKKFILLKKISIFFNNFLHPYCLLNYILL